MDILQQAEKYAEGKANQAITKAIADAYAEGYKAGYNDRENEIPAEFRDDGTEYVDLGLPSGTLWAADWEKRDKAIIYASYDEARTLNLPTREQIDELLNVCRWDYSKPFNGLRYDCIGPNGAVINFQAKGFKKSTGGYEYESSFFWFRTSEDTADNEKSAVVINKSSRSVISLFSGYHLPIRLVR